MGRTEVRSFEDAPARRERVPLLLAAYGPSGGGKTFSALRLATGIQRVSGGDIHVIDTEARRALHYADQFKFRHVPFGAPFSPLDYLAAIEHCAARKAGVIVVDSMSHEHEGPGGVLEWHDSEEERLSKQWGTSRDKVKMTAWQAPKSARRRMINTILQMQTHFIFCFRAKEKLKIVPGKAPEPRGFMPITGEEFVYEMTATALLMPCADGVPTWASEETGEAMMIKRPQQFRELLARFDRRPLCEEIGEAMARWASGDAALPVAAPAPRRNGAPVDPFAAVKRDLLAARCREDLAKPAGAIRATSGGPLTPEQRAELLPILEDREAVLLPRAEQGGDPNGDGR